MLCEESYRDTFRPCLRVSSGNMHKTIEYSKTKHSLPVWNTHRNRTAKYSVKVPAAQFRIAN